MAKQFTEADVRPWLENTGRIFVMDHQRDLIDAPLWWHEQGLQQTASGYGRKLTQRYKINFEGKQYRLYTTIFSNAGSTWFQVKGRKIYVD
jgi:hypothetical protein